MTNCWEQAVVHRIMLLQRSSLYVAFLLRVLDTYVSLGSEVRWTKSRRLERGDNFIRPFNCTVLVSVMNRLLTVEQGRLPFDDDNVPRLLAKVRQGQYHIPSRVPEPAADLLQRMLVVDPDKRISMHDIMLHRWFRGKSASTSWDLVSEPTEVGIRQWVFAYLIAAACRSPFRSSVGKTSTLRCTESLLHLDGVTKMSWLQRCPARRTIWSEFFCELTLRVVQSELRACHPSPVADPSRKGTGVRPSFVHR